MGVIALLGVGIILFTRNIIHAAYALALALVGIAGLYVFIGAELLAVVQILIYAGGVVILLAFGVMLTNRLRGEKLLSESRNKMIGGLISVSLFAILVSLISNVSFDRAPVKTEENQVEQIGVSFLTEHLVAFELIAFVLLVALVGASYLAKMSSNE